MSEWTPERFRTALVEVQKRAAADAAFRQLALQDAGAALQQVSGLALPAGAKVRFVEPTDELVIPLARSRADSELSEEELDVASGAVSSGGCGYTGASNICL